MKLIDLLPYIISLVVPILTGLWAFIASTNKSKKDLQQIQEQNKHDIDRLVNQHTLDLESLEIKHKMDIEKLEIEHRHKIELMQKESENKVGSEMMGLMGTEMIAQIMKSPEIKNKINRATLDGLKKKK